MFLQEFIQGIFDELGHLLEDYLSSGPTDRLRKQLRIMYGRGEISHEKFFQLGNMLDRGYYVEGELAVLHNQALRRMGAEGRVDAQPGSLEVGRGLEQVYIKRAMLEEARAGMHQVLRTVESQRAWALQQSVEFWQRAQSVLPDEEAARAYLEVRQQLVDHLQALDRRAQALQQDMHRLDALDAQLRLYESELMIVDSRERMARVELSMHKELHS